MVVTVTIVIIIFAVVFSYLGTRYCILGRTSYMIYHNFLYTYISALCRGENVCEIEIVIFLPVSPKINSCKQFCLYDMRIKIINVYALLRTQLCQPIRRSVCSLDFVIIYSRNDVQC